MSIHGRLIRTGTPSNQVGNKAELIDFYTSTVIMSSFNDFLKDRRILDIYVNFSAEQKLEWNKLYQEEKKETAATCERTSFHAGECVFILLFNDNPCGTAF
jgi:hypothetical protein